MDEDRRDEMAGADVDSKTVMDPLDRDAADSEASNLRSMGYNVDGEGGLNGMDSNATGTGTSLLTGTIRSILIVLGVLAMFVLLLFVLYG